MAHPKYSLAEIERRWLVSPGFLTELENLPHWVVEDLYVEGTQLRLRKMSSSRGEVIYKFCKKYGRVASLANPMTNIYLSEVEYRTLSVLKGKSISKHRYAIAGGSIDVYPKLPGIAIFEIEFESEGEAAGYVPPDFVGDEVTDDARHSGQALALRVI
ncbi:CYTH domain-containing protein [Dyella koreensis]|uniref:CYTH domain-containing protein n=1 Tax=Dyella koreensis TaxID=311235 RepID=A0ABW8K3M3_9GAMM